MDAEGDAEEDGGEEGEGDHWEMLRRCNEPTTSVLFCLGGSFLRKFSLGKSSGGWWPTSSDIYMTCSSSPMIKFTIIIYCDGGLVPGVAICLLLGASDSRPASLGFIRCVVLFLACSTNRTESLFLACASRAGSLHIFFPFFFYWNICIHRMNDWPAFDSVSRRVCINCPTNLRIGPVFISRGIDSGQASCSSIAAYFVAYYIRRVDQLNMAMIGTPADHNPFIAATKNSSIFHVRVS
jgi:hypothetical protein